MSNANALVVVDAQVVLVVYLALVVVVLMVMELVMELVMVALQEVEQVLQETSGHLQGPQEPQSLAEGLIIWRPGSTVVFPHACCKCLLAVFQSSNIIHTWCPWFQAIGRPHLFIRHLHCC